MAVYADLGGLGTRQGPPVSFAWGMPNLVPLLLPWLAVLVLLAVPSNRKAQAWWIWAPLAALGLLELALGTTSNADNNDELGFIIQAAGAAAFGLAVIWLLGTGLARAGRAAGIVLMTLAFAVVSLLAFIVSPIWEQLWDLRQWAPMVVLYVPLFWLAGGLVYAGALHLAGCACRKRFSRVRVSLWLAPCLWVMWVVAGVLLGCVMRFIFGEDVEWLGFVVASFVFALVSYVTMLPFLILAFVCPFYRARLDALLRLPATIPAPPSPAPVPVTQEVSTK